MTRLILPFSVALLTFGCSEYDLAAKPRPEVVPLPDIVVSPQAIQFSELSNDEQEVKSFVVENIGEAILLVDDIEVVAGSSSFTILTERIAFSLEPGDRKTIDVAFSPAGGENFGSIEVRSDDPDTPMVPVDLLGFGALPELVITPQHFTFHNTPIPCGDSVEIELANAGNEVLVISDLEYSSGGLLTLDAAGLDLPLELAPGEATYVNVHFAAVQAGADTGVLAVTSNDPRGVVQADQNGEGAYDNLMAEDFTEPGVPPVDVMFLIDQSCSMSHDNVDDIEQGIPSFVYELQNVADWQLIQVTQDNGCSNHGVLDSTMNSTGVISDLIREAFNNTWGHNYQTEALLQLASMALAQTGPGQCNAGFLRPGALLHIIVASDEREQSGVHWSNWVADYQSYVSAPDLVKVSAIADLNRRCGDNSGPGGYLEAANATGGATLDICNPHWGAQLTDIASEVLAGIRTYNLAQPAHANSIEVLVNGVPASDWEYNAAHNSVTINSPPIGEGDLVEVNYGVAGECN